MHMMDKAPYREELCEMTRALLVGLERATQGEGGDKTALLQNVLECAGDQRRLGEPMPSWCLHWLSKIDQGAIRAALTRYQDELKALTVSAIDLDEALGFTLTRRDQIASALLAITEWSLRRGHAPVTFLLEWSNVHAAARQCDAALAAVIDRPTAENLLSIRIAIADQPGWLARFSDGAPVQRKEEK